MKRRFLLLVSFTMMVAAGASAQVQVSKQIQMTGTTTFDKRITGLGSVQDTTDAVSAGAIQKSSLTYATATGLSNAYVVFLPVAPAAYTAGMTVTFKANVANTGAATLNVNGLGTRPIYKNGGTALAANDISANQIITAVFDGSNFQITGQIGLLSGFNGNLSGDVSGPQNATLIGNSTINTVKLVDQAVTTGKIADSAVTTQKLANGAVTNAKLADSAVNTINLAGMSVTSGKIANGAVGTTQLAAGSVTNAILADSAVNTINIMSMAVTSAKIADSAVGTLQLATKSVTTAKYADSSITDVKIVGMSYSKLIGAPTAYPPSGVAGGDLAGTYPNPTFSTSSTAGADVINTVNAAATATINAARLDTNVTKKGNTFNGANQLVLLNATGKLPAVDGSQLTNVNPVFPTQYLVSSSSSVDFSSYTTARTFVIDRQATTAPSSLNVTLPAASNFPAGSHIVLTILNNSGSTIPTLNLLASGVTQCITFSGNYNVSTSLTAIGTGLSYGFITNGSSWYRIF